jgi:hypothetical protein
MADIVTSLHGREIGLDAQGRLVVRNGINNDTAVNDFGGSPSASVAVNDAAITRAEASINTASGGGVLRFPAGDWNYTYRLPSSSVVWAFDGPLVNRGDLGGGATVNYRTAVHAYHPGPHATTRTTTEAIRTVAYGSGANGVAVCDAGHEVNIFKDNWTDPALAQVGEIDGQGIVLRQGGPTTGTKSSAGGQVIDVQMTNGTGFLCSFEHVSTVVDQTAGLSILYQIGSQNAVLNSRDGDYYGHVWKANVGTMDACIYVGAESGASWNDILRNVKTSYFNYKINNDGKQTWNGANSTGTTITLGGEADGSIHIRDGSGVDLWNISNAGAVTTPLMVGVTASRPTLVAGQAGAMYYDTTLQKPIWWTGTAWKDATGTTV